MIEETLANLGPQHKKMLSEYTHEFETEPVEKRLNFLGLENKQLLTELRRLNEFLTILVEYRRGSMAYLFL